MAVTAGTAQDTVHTATAHMREHHGPDHPRHAFWHHLADKLDHDAEREYLLAFSPTYDIAMLYLASVEE